MFPGQTLILLATFRYDPTKGSTRRGVEKYHTYRYNLFTMPKLRLLLSVFFSFSFALSSLGSSLETIQDQYQYLHKTWTSRDGLPQNTVNCFVRDYKGYLWLGTENGVVRFDGLQFKSFKNLKSFKNTGKITSLLVSTKGTLWIGTYGTGAACYSNKRFITYSTANGLPCNFIRSIVEDKQQNIWLGTESKGVIRFKNNIFTSFSTANGLSHNNVTSLLVDGYGNLWVGTDNGLNLLNNGKFTVFTIKDGLPDNHITTLCIDKRGYLWVGTVNGTARLRSRTNRKTFKTLERLKACVIHSIMEDRNGILWIGSDKGIYRVVSFGSPGDKSSIDVRRFVFKEGSFYNSVISMYEDSEGVLWFGTSGKGFGNRYPSQFRFYSVNDGLSRPHVTAVYQDDQGDIWVGTRGGGLNRFRDGTFKAYTRKDGLCSDWITSIYGDKTGIIWIGTPVGLNQLKNGKFKTFTFANGLSGSSIRSLYVDSSGNTWIGTNGSGLNLYNPVDKKFRNFGVENGLSNLFISVITGDIDGNLWVGTHKGLFRLIKPVRDWRDGRFRGFTFKEGLSCDIISDIYAAPDGAVWIATSGGGLNRYQHGEFTAFKNQGYPFGRTISRILEDDWQRLWLTTANGILCVPKKELKIYPGAETGGIDYYHLHEGVLKTVVFSGGCQPAGWKTADGRLWLPTIDGITVVPNSKNIFSPGPQQKVHIEMIVTDGIAIDLEKIDRFPAGTKKIAFYCNAPNYTAPEILKYKFRLGKAVYDLLGNLWADMDEIRVSGDNKIEYLDLPAGRYVFTVYVGSSAASVEFYIRQLFFETVWFYLLLLFIGLMAAAVVFTFIKRWSKERVMMSIWTHDEKYKTFKIKNKESKRYLKKLLEVMEKEKPFLDAEITMPELAEKIDISKEVLSQVINRELHLNFNAFLNRYRVEAAKQKLRDPKENRFVILKIALDVGFNSKSSFNAVFKKTTGMSPSEYREKYQKK